MLAVAGLFASCNNDDIGPDTPNTPTTGYHLTFDGGVGIDDATRAAWTDDAGSGNLVFNWDYTPKGEDGNEMVMALIGSEYVASNSGKYSSYMNIVEHTTYPEDKHWAVFKTVETYDKELSSEEYEGYNVIAVTPMIAANGSTVTSTFKEFIAEMPMPDSFTQNEDQKPGFLRNYMYMYAKTDIVRGTATLGFKHIPATFRFIITNKRPDDATINSVEVMVVDDAGTTYPVAAQKATIEMNGDNSKVDIKPTFTGEYNAVITRLAEGGTSVTKNDTYTAYALALPLADNNAFQGKRLQFSINATNPANEHLAFTLDAEKIANANKNYGDNIYNWVGGKSYTIRMSLDDVLTFEGISVSDWTDGGIIDGGEVEEEINE